MAGGIALANTLLIRHGRGYMEVSDPASVAQWGRIESHLSLGGLVDPVQIEQQVLAFLALSGQLSLTVTAGIEPFMADTPYEDFTLGDTLTIPDESGVGTAQEQVVSLTVGEDANGEPTFISELGIAEIIHEQRIQHWLTRLLSGTVAGTANSASPVDVPPPAGPESTDEILMFEQPGKDSSGGTLPLRSGESNSQPVNRTGVLYKVSVFLDGPLVIFGSGPNICTIYINHTSIGTVTVPAGKQNFTDYFSEPVACALGQAPDVVSVNFTTVDGIAFGGTVLVSIK